MNNAWHPPAETRELRVHRHAHWPPDRPIAAFESKTIFCQGSRFLDEAPRGGHDCTVHDQLEIQSAYCKTGPGATEIKLTPTGRFRNRGRLDVEQGRLRFDMREVAGPAWENAGQVQVRAGAELVLSGGPASQLWIEGDVGIDGRMRVDVDAGALHGIARWRVGQEGRLVFTRASGDAPQSRLFRGVHYNGQALFTGRYEIAHPGLEGYGRLELVDARIDTPAVRNAGTIIIDPGSYLGAESFEQTSQRGTVQLAGELAAPELMLMSGRLATAASGGIFSGALTTLAGGTLEIPVLDAERCATLEVRGPVTLRGGTLAVTLPDGIGPGRWTLLRASTLTGEFKSFTCSPLRGSLSAALSYRGDALELTVSEGQAATRSM
ncbi:hypothetical protein [Caldimonas brevitalea]|uniref:Uncharacterized protein n=1 Tax=Caldimonas brevitalea TaxID=413882 RepID=A0A0G3BNY2_9BURK|nr:hypothetical protein [Caldimonas brevitalea]AKJ29061.1 hypothetical protein AAW51_2370 [Caldimonas brevitalea]